VWRLLERKKQSLSSINICHLFSFCLQIQMIVRSYQLRSMDGVGVCIDMFFTWPALTLQVIIQPFTHWWLPSGLTNIHAHAFAYGSHCPKGTLTWLTELKLPISRIEGRPARRLPNHDAIIFSSFCIGQYHKLEMCLRGFHRAQGTRPSQVQWTRWDVTKLVNNVWWRDENSSIRREERREVLSVS